MTDIYNNVKEVMERINVSAKLSGRDPSEVTLVGVTKTQSPENVLEMIKAGVNVAGENRVQELLPKREAISEAKANVDWHMIGHLQTNKVRQVIGKVSLIHSVDSYKLAEEINRLSQDMADILMEINIAGEPGKFGVKPVDAIDLAKLITRLPLLRLRGLMCVAPITDNPDDNRMYFKQMRKILLDISKETLHNYTMEVLSMGMTLDYEAAVMEGATMVRVGTGIFGKRVSGQGYL